MLFLSLPQVWSTGPVTHLPSREPETEPADAQPQHVSDPPAFRRPIAASADIPGPAQGRKRIAPNKVRPAASDWKLVNLLLLPSVSLGRRCAISTCYRIWHLLCISWDYPHRWSLDQARGIVGQVVPWSLFPCLPALPLPSFSPE
jgi:hypothetical protein